MSTHYFMYTEMNIDGKWLCINNRLKDVQKGTERLCDTYYSDRVLIFMRQQTKSKKSVVL